jgi:TatD DNase family protein
MEAFDEDRDEAIGRALSVGVETMQVIGTHPGEMDAIVDLIERHPCLWGSVGLHPDKMVALVQDIRGFLHRYLAHPKIVGIGETGLDYYHTGREYAEAQQASFREHLSVALQTDVPVIVHSRDAEEDTLALLSEATNRGALRVVIHCFTGSAAFAEAVLAMGAYISFSGIVSFKNAAALQAVVPLVPLDRLLIETDAPYLAPVPYRGKRNESAFVVQVAEAIAKLRDVPVATIAECSTENFYRLFTRVTPPC